MPKAPIASTTDAVLAALVDRPGPSKLGDKVGVLWDRQERSADSDDFGAVGRSKM